MDFPLQNKKLFDPDTIGSLFGKRLPPKDLEKLYATAYNFYEKDDLEMAMSIFRLLVQMNPTNKKYWIGIGACLQLQDDFKAALRSYAMAALLDANDPHPHLYTAECWFALGNNEETTKALDRAAECANFGDWYDSHLLSRIAKMRLNLS